MRFGDFLKNRRKQLNITQEDLARSLNVSSVFIHQMEKGKVDAPCMERCEQIAEILEISVVEIWNVARRERLKKFMDKEEIFEQNLELLNESEKALINLYRALNNEIKRDFNGMIFMLLRHAKDESVQEILEEFIKCA
ncbi:MAG: helix-turn-helix transcriptional regulator [Thermodesulfobacteriota bacterium]